MHEIGILSRRVLPADGGVEHFLYDLLSAMRQDYLPRIAAQILRDGADFPGVDDCFARSYNDEEYKGLFTKALTPAFKDRLRLLPCALKLLPILRGSFYGPLKNIAVRQFASVYQKRIRDYFQDVHLIHSFAFDGLGLLGSRVASHIKVPFIITPFMHPKKWGDGIHNINLYNSADAVIALHKEDVLSLKRIGVDENLIHECGIGINPFSGDGERFRKKHSIKGTLVLFIGRMVEHKGYRELALAVRKLRLEGRDITLMLIGPAGKAAAKFLEEQRMHGVVYLGTTDDEEKHDALRACDLFCLPSTSEIMPVTILEAWWAGKPVLAGDIPSLHAFVEEGVNGLFTVRDIDAIREKLLLFMSVHNRFRGLGDHGRKKVEEQYLIRHIADRLKDVYSETISRRDEVTRILPSSNQY